MLEKFSFTERQISQYYRSALKDFKIARGLDIPEVIFKFSYDALLKLSIAVCAYNGLRVKSRQGHHVELINKLSKLFGDEEIEIIGNEIRAKRNKDLYGGGVIISAKEAAEFLKWTGKIFEKAEYYLYKKSRMF